MENENNNNNRKDAAAILAERKKRLFDIRLEMVLVTRNIISYLLQNKVRKDNTKLVYEEDQKKKEPTTAEAKREREQYYSEKDKHKEELKEQGMDPEKEELLSTTA